MLIISIFLIGKDVFKVSYQLFVNQSSHFTLFEDHEMLKNISVIGYIAAIAAMVYPLLSGREWEKKYFALAIIWPLINLAWLFIMIVMVKNEIRQYRTEKSAKYRRV